MLERTLVRTFEGSICTEKQVTEKGRIQCLKRSLPINRQGCSTRSAAVACCGLAFWSAIFGLTSKSERNLINALKSSFRPGGPREGTVGLRVLAALYRGAGTGLAPILLAATEE